MIRHQDLNDETLHSMIRKREIVWGGNARLKIYGTLHCGSGKRMKRMNRIFFKNVEEARNAGYRRLRELDAAGLRMPPSSAVLMVAHCQPLSVIVTGCH